MVWGVGKMAYLHMATKRQDEIQEQNPIYSKAMLHYLPNNAD